MYAPPANSVYHKGTEVTNGISPIEQCMLDAIEMLEDLTLVVLGDLNSGTCPDNATEVNNDNCETFDIFASNDDSSVDELTKRASKYNGLNEFGKYLIYMYDQFNIIILNGLSGMVEDCGNFNYISTSGCSVTDNVTVSRNLLRLCLSLYVADKMNLSI